MLVLSSFWQMFFTTFLFLSCMTIASGQDDKKPNVLIVMTDEHNLRTIGKYRELLGASSSNSSQAFIWGEDVKVPTDNIDSLAADGATFANFYTASPVCTTSRGTFFTGTYPSTNGAVGNSIAMNGDALTFAQVMNDAGYRTGYIGKWHLNGKEKSRKSFGAPEGRLFGFEDTEFQWNRGHWKCLQKKNGKLRGFKYKQCAKKFLEKNNMSKNYATDFLTTKAIQFMKRQQQNNETFALVLSIPDPHSPNQVRPPYDTMYDDLSFRIPETAKMAVRKKPSIPKWSYVHENYRNVPPSVSSQKIEEVEKSRWYQNQQKKIFGMVKLIDDNVGRILRFLEETGLEKDTIVIFTSDHGDLMHEHGKIDKVLPYKTSASVPMIVRWPEKIKAGKDIHSAYSSVDVAPTILSLVGINHEKFQFEGIDASADLLDDSPENSAPSQIRFIDGPTGRYAAAVTERYKLVLNRRGTPWLFDMKEDPDEIYNFYKKNKEIEIISTKLTEALRSAMEEYDFGMLKRDDPIYLDRPACEETRDAFDDVVALGLPIHTCEDVEETQSIFCDSSEVNEFCPVTCNTCVEDSSGQMTFLYNDITCKEVKEEPETLCTNEWINKFCLETCSNYTHT